MSKEMYKKVFEEIFLENIHRAGSEELLRYLENSSFFDDPASTKYHLASEGGLCLHSIHVYRRLFDLCKSESTWKDRSFTMPSVETISIVGLLHDLCKAGTYKVTTKNQKFYDPEKVAAAEPWRVKHDSMGDFVWDTVQSYVFEDPMPMGHGSKSVILIQRFMPLTDDEIYAILHHMGTWGTLPNGADTNAVSAAYTKSTLALLTHMADELATYVDEKEEGEK